jgi:hypothetical protein
MKVVGHESQPLKLLAWCKIDYYFTQMYAFTTYFLEDWYYFYVITHYNNNNMLTLYCSLIPLSRSCQYQHEHIHLVMLLGVHGKSS